jgi:hypothetical protein
VNLECGRYQYQALQVCMRSSTYVRPARVYLEKKNGAQAHFVYCT